jgi:DNA processing protein
VLSAAERIAWLRLARTSRVGPVTFAQLIRRYQAAEKALAALPGLARRGGGKIGATPSVADAESEIAATEAAGGRLIMSCEPDFPKLLRALDPPPPVIGVLGRVELLQKRSVALVGARNASALGRRFAEDVARDLGKGGFVVVSGLARGIDAAAHLGSLATGTVAVVAGGLAHVYPPEHEELHRRIAKDGAIVSENPLRYEPTARDFPRRNRLISGLSLGVVVIEAAERSGSLITARFALEQGREVMAAPGSPLDPRARGSNRLIREGATLIESGADVSDVLSGLPLGRAEEPGRGYGEEPMDEATLEAEADRIRETVFELLSPSPTHQNDLIRFSGASAAAVLAALVELELAGRANLLPGGLAVRAE